MWVETFGDWVFQNLRIASRSPATSARAYCSVNPRSVSSSAADARTGVEATACDCASAGVMRLKLRAIIDSAVRNVLGMKRPLPCTGSIGNAQSFAGKDQVKKLYFAQ